nr:MAG TPA: hypothetical protein [Caudoviricetes sp.]
MAETKKTKNKEELTGKERRMANLIPLSQRSPEERRAIARKGIEARKANVEKRKQEKRERMQIQKVMSVILGSEVSNEKQKKLLNSLGFEGEHLTNEMLLMVALFKKGLSGDVNAIRDVTEMMEKLDLYQNSGGEQQQQIVINLMPKGTGYKPSEKIEEQIQRAENGLPLESSVEDDSEWITEDDDEDWGNEVYDPD